MPYSNKFGGWERSRSIGHVPIAKSEFVQERLNNYRVFAPEPNITVDRTLISDADALKVPGPRPRWVISFDGSSHEVAVREEHPSTRVGYVQVAGVLVDLTAMLSEGEQHLVDPAVVRSTTQEALYSIVMPGSNICRRDMPTVRESWRAEVFEVFREYKVEDIPLLDILMLLVRHSEKGSASGGVMLARCPASDRCRARNIEVAAHGTDCPSCGETLFPTDGLRLHEEVSEEHGNATALGRLMTCLEHITFVAYAHFLEQRRPQSLGEVAFLLDGPLALFGPQAWLHVPMLNFLRGLCQSLVARRFRSPILVGIEKAGQFAEHAAAIERHIMRRQLMQLPDTYIYEHILTFRQSPTSTFGRDTYYGQKFFYKTAQGHILPITLPKICDETHDPHLPSHYAMLPDTLALLDRIGTSLYKDAVIPVALAHSFASIPLRTGSKVLTLLSREHLGV